MNFGGLQSDPPLSTQTFATAFGLSPPSSVGGLSCSPLAKGGSVALSVRK
jgi:hypothetical protein